MAIKIQLTVKNNRKEIIANLKLNKPDIHSKKLTFIHPLNFPTFPKIPKLKFANPWPKIINFNIKQKQRYNKLDITFI